MFVRGLCEDLGYPLHGELILGVDNEAAIKIANNAGVTARNKHFDRCFHLIREQVSYLKLKLVHVKTHDQLADYLTKPLDEFNFLKCREFSMKGTK